MRFQRESPIFKFFWRSAGPQFCSCDYRDGQRIEHFGFESLLGSIYCGTAEATTLYLGVLMETGQLETDWGGGGGGKGGKPTMVLWKPG